MSEERDIDDIIKSLEDSDNDKSGEENLPAKKEQENEVESIDSEVPDVTEDDEVIKSVFKMTLEDRKKADDAYEIFAPEIAKGTDRSSASKEAMMKAIELKIGSVKNIIEVMKLKQRKDNPAVGVFVDTQNQKKVGIDLKNIANSLDDDES